MLLTCIGTATLARIVMPEPLFCALHRWGDLLRIKGTEAAGRWRWWMVGLWTLLGSGGVHEGTARLGVSARDRDGRGWVIPEWRGRVSMGVSDGCSDFFGDQRAVVRGDRVAISRSIGQPLLGGAMGPSGREFDSGDELHQRAEVAVSAAARAWFFPWSAWWLPRCCGSRWG